jgi:hypothetical protein
MVSGPPSSLTDLLNYSFTLLNAVYGAYHAPILMPVSGTSSIIRGRCHGKDTPKVRGIEEAAERNAGTTGSNSLLLEEKKICDRKLRLTVYWLNSWGPLVAW